jgi:hypothetical protein
MGPAGLRPENDCTGDDQQQLQTTDPSSRQRWRPTSTNRICLTGEKKSALGPPMGLDTKTDWSTGRNTPLTDSGFDFDARAFCRRVGAE